MAQQELSCAACGTRFLSQAFCPSCGVPTVIASTEQQLLWEMGQSNNGTAEPPPASIKLASVPPIPDPTGSPKPPTPRTKPFSPVPLPRKSADENGARAAHPARSRVVERAPRQTPSKRDRTPDSASSKSGSAAATTSTVKSAPAEHADQVPDAAPADLARAPSAKPRVVTGSVIKRAGKAAKDAEPAPVQPPVVTRVAKREAKKQARFQRKIDRLLHHLGAAEGETVTASLDGTLGFRPSTMLVTNYRVAIVPHAKRAKCRWIPLEEVTRISCSVGSSNLIVDASVEVLRFGTRRAHRLQTIVGLLRAEVKEARTSRGADRHNAVIVQAWCDRTSEIWDSRWGRLRLWLDHHPKARLVMFAPLVPVGYLITRLL